MSYLSRNRVDILYDLFLIDIEQITSLKNREYHDTTVSSTSLALGNGRPKCTRRWANCFLVTTGIAGVFLSATFVGGFGFSRKEEGWWWLRLVVKFMKHGWDLCEFCELCDFWMAPNRLFRMVGGYYAWIFLIMWHVWSILQSVI